MVLHEPTCGCQRSLTRLRHRKDADSKVLNQWLLYLSGKFCFERQWGVPLVDDDNVVAEKNELG